MDDWFVDPSKPDCRHGSVPDTHELSDGEVPGERCVRCRAVRFFVGRPELRVAYRSEPLTFRKVDFPAKAEPPDERVPNLRPKRWWLPGSGGPSNPGKRHA